MMMEILKMVNVDSGSESPSPKVQEESPTRVPRPHTWGAQREGHEEPKTGLEPLVFTAHEPFFGLGANGPSLGFMTRHVLSEFVGL